MASADLILSAISGALKLGAQARSAYVDSTRNRALTLPLPDFNPDPTPLAAVMFFGSRTVTEPSRLVALIERGDRLSEAEQQELVHYHHEALLAVLAVRETKDGSIIGETALDALVRVRQWQREPNPSLLQRMAGSLIEIGVDYFASGPGAAGVRGRHGDALKALLTGLDQLDVVSELQLGTLPLRLFNVTMDTVTAFPQAFTGDARSQQIIAAAAKGITADVAGAIEKARAAGGPNDLKESSIRDWGELAYRSVLSSVGQLVLAEPQRFLGITGEAQAALVSSVGGTVLALALNDAGDGMLGGFDKEGLELVAASALRVVAKYPQLVTGGGSRLDPLVAQIAADSRGIDLSGGSLAPAVAQIVLARTAENLPMLWPDPADPERHLARLAAKTVLEIASRPPPAGARWRLAFGQEDLLAVLDNVLNELTRNPGWLVKRDGELSPALATVLNSTLEVFRKRGDQRLGAELARELLQRTLEAAASRSEFLTEVPGRGPLAAAVIDVVLEGAFGGDADGAVAWRLVQQQVLVEVVQTAFRELEQAKLDNRKIAVLEAVFRDTVTRIKSGEGWSVAHFGDALSAALAAA
jgi:hypothetical protein